MAKNQPTQLGNLGVGSTFRFAPGQPVYKVVKKSGDEVTVELAGVIGGVTKLFGAPQHKFPGNTQIVK